MSSSRALDELKEKKMHLQTQSYRDTTQMHTNNMQHAHTLHTHKQVVFIQNTWSPHRCVTVMFQ